MLLRCNLGCKESDGTTEGSLDPETYEVVCKKCGVFLDNVAEFTKRTMKNNKDFIKKEPKAFTFKCQTCLKEVQTIVEDDHLRGVSCQKECKFLVSRFMINSMKSIEDEK